MSELIDRKRFSADMRDFQNRVGIWRDEAEDTETRTRADAALATIIETKLILDKQPTVATASPWHRVEEPPKDGLYGKLVCDTEGQISVCGGYATVKLQNGSVVYTDSRLLDIFKEETDNWNWEDITHFTHWMPLPEPPKEDA